MLIKDIKRVPPGGYDYVQPETGVSFNHFSFPQLLKKIKEHRLANNLPVPLNFSKQIENDWCMRHLDFCTFEEVDKPPSLAEMAWDFTKAMIKWGKSGFATVDEKVFEQRKAICLSCPFFKGWQDAGIGYCKRCGCAVGKASVKLMAATSECKEHKW